MFRINRSAKGSAMRRFSILILTVLLGHCVSGSTPGAPSPVRSQRLEIASTPVLLDSSDPARRRIGDLTYLGGWQLSSDARVFGGLSALDVNGNEVTAVSDVGAIVRFRLGRFGSVSDATITRVPSGCGPVVHKSDNDTESLAHDDARQTWWIGMEARNVICRTNADFSQGKDAAPAAIAGWRRKKGPETLLRLSNGSFLTIAERARDIRDDRPAVLFDRDPTDPAARTITLKYRPPDGFDPTDAAQLPDGRILVMNRRFALTSLFTATLVLLDPSAMAKGDVLTGRVVARFEPPFIGENFEGVAVTTEKGRPIIWIVSDDNYERWQRTLLLKFALD
jgi:hypothetical protein